MKKVLLDVWRYVLMTQELPCQMSVNKPYRLIDQWNSVKNIKCILAYAKIYDRIDQFSGNDTINQMY
jgi:hypothetical protein